MSSNYLVVDFQPAQKRGCSLIKLSACPEISHGLVVSEMISEMILRQGTLCLFPNAGHNAKA